LLEKKGCSSFLLIMGGGVSMGKEGERKDGGLLGQGKGGAKEGDSRR
jgi:hypothetical protein